MATHSSVLSCLENPRDGEAWWAAIYGVTQSRTQLKRLSSISSSSSDVKHFLTCLPAICTSSFVKCWLCFLSWVTFFLLFSRKKVLYFANNIFLFCIYFLPVYVLPIHFLKGAEILKFDAIRDTIKRVKDNMGDSICYGKNCVLLKFIYWSSKSQCLKMNLEIGSLKRQLK